MDYDMFIKQGKELGYADEALQQFVSNRVELEREKLKQEQEERDAQRTERKAQRELEKLKIEAEKTIELEKIQNEKMKIKQDHELDMSHNEHGDRSIHEPTLYNPSKTRLPVFDESKDHMESFIERFERWATGRKIPEDSWALELSILLQGKALDVYTRMETAKALEYKSLKLALMERFRLTEEGFRQKFRKSKPEKGETPSQFVVRIGSFIQKWFELAKVANLDEAIDICIREQFFRVCSNNLTLYLKERECKSIDTVIHWAEMFVEAHGLHSFYNTGFVNKNDHTFNKQTGQNRNMSGKGAQSSDEKSSKLGQSNSGNKNRYCYKCKSPNHISPNCPRKKPGQTQNYKTSTGMAMVQQDPDVNIQADSDISGSEPQGCNCTCQCKENVEVSKVNVGEGCIVDESNGSSDCISGEYVTLSCGRQVKVLHLAYDLNKTMPVMDGRMLTSGRKVSVLRDTGSSAVVIRSSLVLDSEYTGKKEMVILIDGTARVLPTAVVKINTPFFSGKTEAIVVEKPIYDVIIGNIPEARNTSNPDPNWESYTQTHSTSITNINESEVKVVQPEVESNETNSELEVKSDKSLCRAHSHAVVTRGQAKKLEKPIKPLKSPSAISDISPSKLVKAQEQDPSLSNCWERAKHPTQHTDTKQLYLVHKGWLFRQTRDPNDNTKGIGPKQLVVPSDFRVDIMKVAHEALLGGHLGIKKTMDKICTQFYWPAMQQDISNFCKSCDVCQRTISKGRKGSTW
jgi:hypothetical protein